MKPYIRLGDPTDHSGVVISGSPTYFIDGKPIARVGDTVTCPRRGHGPTVIITGDSSTLVDGRPAARESDLCACGCRLLATQGASVGE